MKSLLAFWGRRNTFAKILLGFAALCLFNWARMAIVGEPFTPTSQPEPQSVASSAPAADAISPPEKAVRPYLRRTLKDWDSYESVGYSTPEYVSPPAGYSGYAWRVRHQYRAKNSFGAYVLNDQLFYYTANGVYNVEGPAN